jgi:hypothetical protein
MPQFYSILRKLAAIALLVSGLFGASVFATPSQLIQPVTLYRYEDRSNPVLQVAAYYNAINLQDYQRAFSYWESPPTSTPTLAQFADGFANTERVSGYTRLPVNIGVGAGNAYADVPVILVAQHTDGSIESFAGCFRTHKLNVPVGDATEPDPNWRLQSATIQVAASFDLSMLDTSCEALETIGGYDSQFSPVDVLTSYYDAINNGDYARAFSYWETPPTSTPTLEQFTAGFANTQHVTLTLGLDILGQGAAGSSYTSLPVLAASTQTDGSIINYRGCFIVRRSNVPVGNATEPDPNWRLTSANLSVVQDVDDALNLLSNVCNV